MIEIDDTIISEEVISNNFVCNLDKCKGACCVQGDRGAPIEAEELHLLGNELNHIAPFMNPEYLNDVLLKGIAETDEDGELVLNCQPSGECNFVVYEAMGVAQCAIEKAWKAGATKFQKPVSCHLYPIRVARYRSFRAVNYHEWRICQPACVHGNALKVPMYVFVKDALIRKFGSEWYDKLDAVAKHIEENRA